MATSVQSVAAELTREAAETLITVATATPQPKRSWTPLHKGRSMIEQLAECVLANTKWTGILRTRRYADVPRDLMVQTYQELKSLDAIAIRLRETANDLAEAISAVPNAAVSEEIETPWGPYSLARCCLHAYWNMVYHEGQINYIQTLYGDYEEHEA